MSGWRKKQIKGTSMTQEALNIAGQCRATASSPLAKNISVDEGNGLLTELLLDAAKVIEALAQPEQEPVAWMDVDGNVSDNNDHKCFPIPLYTQPPQRTWVGLTDTQIEQVYFEVKQIHLGAAMPWGQVQFGRALLEKFKEVNQ